MVSGLALRRWTRGLHAVLGAGGPACDALHRASARYRADDADGQAFVERRAHAAFIGCVACVVDLGERGSARCRNALSYGALSTLVAVERTAAAAADEGVARTMSRHREFTRNASHVGIVIALTVLWLAGHFFCLPGAHEEQPFGIDHRIPSTTSP